MSVGPKCVTRRVLLHMSTGSVILSIQSQLQPLFIMSFGNKVCCIMFHQLIVIGMVSKELKQGQDTSFHSRIASKLLTLFLVAMVCYAKRENQHSYQQSTIVSDVKNNILFIVTGLSLADPFGPELVVAVYFESIDTNVHFPVQLTLVQCYV